MVYLKYSHRKFNDLDKINSYVISIKWGDIMGNDRTEELLLQLIQDMAEVKAKLNNIDGQKLSSRVDLLEAQTREQERIIRTLENRETTLEEFIRNNINEANRSNKAVWVSIGIAFLTASLSFLINL